MVELEEAHNAAMNDPEFWKEWKSLYGYMNRPSNLYKAEKLTEHAGGATIWLKREDLYVFPALGLIYAIDHPSVLGITLVRTRSTTLSVR